MALNSRLKMNHLNILSLILMFAVADGSENDIGNFAKEYPLESEALAGLEGVSEHIDKECEAFFHQYGKEAGNFTSCELNNAKPFRVCTGCIAQYALLDALYQDFMENPKLKKCREKYIMSDRVQIIPTMQKNLQDLWEVADCKDCSENVHVDPVTGIVNYSIPEDLAHFLELYVNLSVCVHMNLTNENSWYDLHFFSSFDNVSHLCVKCKDEYRKLNNHYDKVSSENSDLVCMDMVDMMNHTRLMWSKHLNCSHRTGDHVSVALITCFVGVSPLFFYITLKLTGTEKRKKILIQKRLTQSSGDVMSSMSRSYARASGDSNNVRHLRPMS